MCTYSPCSLLEGSSLRALLVSCLKYVSTVLSPALLSGLEPCVDVPRKKCQLAVQQPHWLTLAREYSSWLSFCLPTRQCSVLVGYGLVYRNPQTLLGLQYLASAAVALRMAELSEATILFTWPIFWQPLAICRDVEYIPRVSWLPRGVVGRHYRSLAAVIKGALIRSELSKPRKFIKGVYQTINQFDPDMICTVCAHTAIEVRT